jgi:hypothetical protein
MATVCRIPWWPATRDGIQRVGLVVGLATPI